MKKNIKILIALTLCAQLFTASFVLASDITKLEKWGSIEKKLIHDPINKHWILSKASGWRAAFLALIPGFLATICSANFVVKMESEQKDASGRYSGKDEEKNKSVRKQFKEKEMLGNKLIGLSLLATVILPILAHRTTNKIIRKPFYAAFRDYLEHYEEHRNEIPKKLIPLLDDIKNNYDCAKNKDKFIKKITFETLHKIYENSPVMRYEKSPLTPYIS